MSEKRSQTRLVMLEEPVLGAFGAVLGRRLDLDVPATALGIRCAGRGRRREDPGHRRPRSDASLSAFQPHGSVLSPRGLRRAGTVPARLLRKAAGFFCATENSSLRTEF